MSDLKRKALRVTVLTALGERVTEEAKRARADLLAVMQEVGAERVAAELPGGDAVASVTLAGAKGGRAYVADESAFAAYVAEAFPAEMEYTVRAAFRRKLLDELSKDGEAVPGVKLADPRPYLSNRFKADGKEAIAAAVTDGRLPLTELLALPAAPELARETHIGVGGLHEGRPEDCPAPDCGPARGES